MYLNFGIVIHVVYANHLFPPPTLFLSLSPSLTLPSIRVHRFIFGDRLIFRVSSPIRRDSSAVELHFTFTHDAKMLANGH